MLALLDSGATEIFLNLKYARHMKYPIKQFDQLQKLFNVDRTENKARDCRELTTFI